jgi:hypothetical protein
MVSILFVSGIRNQEIEYGIRRADGSRKADG